MILKEMAPFLNACPVTDNTYLLTFLLRNLMVLIDSFLI